MPRRSKTSPLPPVPAPDVIPKVAPVIDPRAVYTLGSGRAALGLAKGCLPREIRQGRLRAAKRAGRYLILGAWLLEWIETGEVKRPRRTSGEPLNGVHAETAP